MMKTVSLAIGLIAALAFALVWLAIRSEREWQRYAAAHHCQRIGTKEGYWYPMTQFDGRNTYTTMQYSGDIGIYRCDGGKIREH